MILSSVQITQLSVHIIIKLDVVMMDAVSAYSSFLSFCIYLHSVPADGLKKFGLAYM